MTNAYDRSANSDAGRPQGALRIWVREVLGQYPSASARDLLEAAPRHLNATHKNVVNTRSKVVHDDGIGDPGRARGAVIPIWQTQDDDEQVEADTPDEDEALEEEEEPASLEDEPDGCVEEALSARVAELHEHVADLSLEIMRLRRALEAR